MNESNASALTEEAIATGSSPTTSLQARIASRMENVSEAATLLIAARAQQLRKEGRNIISLSTGEPDYPTPENIKAAARKAMDENYTRYTPAEGSIELRRAVAEKFSRENGIRSSFDTVQISSGGKHALSNAISVLVQTGDEVIIPAPYWVSYPAMVAVAEGTVKVISSSVEKGWLITADDLERAITPRSKVLILNSPTNPTSVMYSEEQLRSFVPAIQRSGITVLSDELYEKLTFDGRKHFSIGSVAEIADQVITVNGVSKAYAMTGWRVGYATGPRHIIDAMNRLQSQMVSHPSSISQRAALEAITGPQDAVEFMRAGFQARRDLVVSLLSEIADIDFTMPTAGFYVFFRIRKFIGAKAGGHAIDSAASLCTYLLEHFDLALVPGDAFGEPTAIRLSFAASESDIREGVLRLRNGLNSLS